MCAGNRVAFPKALVSRGVSTGEAFIFRINAQRLKSHRLTQPRALAQPFADARTPRQPPRAPATIHGCTLRWQRDHEVSLTRSRRAEDRGAVRGAQSLQSELGTLCRCLQPELRQPELRPSLAALPLSPESEPSPSESESTAHRSCFVRAVMVSLSSWQAGMGQQDSEVKARRTSTKSEHPQN